MHARQLLFGDLRRFDFLQPVQYLRGHELVADGDQALRAFRVAHAHIVLQTVRVGDVGGEPRALQAIFQPGQHVRFLVAYNGRGICDIDK